jgi:hypothetical protein
MITRSVAISMRSVPCYSHSFAVCARARAPRPRSRQVASRNREAGARGRGAASSTGRANDNEAEAGNNTPGGRVTAAAFAAARPRKGTRPRPSSHFSPIKPRAPLVHSSLAHPPRGSQTACARLPVHNLPASPLPPSEKQAPAGPPHRARAYTHTERETARSFGVPLARRTTRAWRSATRRRSPRSCGRRRSRSAPTTAASRATRPHRTCARAASRRRGRRRRLRSRPLPPLPQLPRRPPRCRSRGRRSWARRCSWRLRPRPRASLWRPRPGLLPTGAPAAGSAWG